MLNLSNILEKVGAIFQTELSQNINLQKQIDGRSFSPIKPSTAKARAAVIGANKVRQNRHGGAFFNRGIDQIKGRERKSVAKSVPITRLLFTKKFFLGAFQYKAYADYVLVFASRGMYPGHFTQSAVSYADIVRFNNAGTKDTNPNITNPPKIFPLTNEDIKGMPAYGNALRYLNTSSVRKQIEEQILAKGIARSIEVKV